MRLRHIGLLEPMVLGLFAMSVVAACQTERDVPRSHPSDRLFLHDPEPVLTLAGAARDGYERRVDVVFSPVDEDVLPRILDVYVGYSAEQLQLLGHVPGAAAAAADKQVIVQDDPQRGRVRVLVMAGAVLNTNRISAGTLAQLHFRKKTDEPTELRFDTNVQVAAPAEAMDQITFGPPLAL